MNDLTKKDYVNILIEGAAMFFVMMAFLFVTCKNLDYGKIQFRYAKEDLLLAVVFFQAIVTWVLLYIRKIPNKITVILAYAFIIGIVFYAIADEHICDAYIEKYFLFLVFIVMEAAWLDVRYVHNQCYHKKPMI